MADLEVILDARPPAELLQRTECERCAERGRALEAVSHGNPPGLGHEPPTPQEIRWALDRLDEAERMLAPYGQLVTVGKGKRALTICPRCTNIGTDENPIPLVALLDAGETLDRATRRRLDIFDLRRRSERFQRRTA